MTEQDPPVEDDELQFDRVVPQAGPVAPHSALAVTCAACRTLIEREYFDVNGSVFCAGCRVAAESAAEVPRGLGPLLTSAVFGLGAGIAGAAIYYAVIAIAHLEIGIVAILIGYMVGYAVRKGARGRGGRRFQVLAAALTYASVALAYTPIVVTQAIKVERARQTDASTTRNAAQSERRITTPRPLNAGRIVLAVGLVAASIAALPVLVTFSGFPSSLIGAFIIFIGMRQAWTMTRAPWLQVLGPYRVGDRAALPA